MAKPKIKIPLISRRWLFVIGVLAGLFIILAAWSVYNSQASEAMEAPEAQKILDIQAGMPFQVLIPSYLPKGFDRPNMEIDTSQIGPGGEPMVQLTYRTRTGEKLFIREWVPVNPAMETLAGSRPVETKWGSAWLLRQGNLLTAIWVDIGPLRASIYSPDTAYLPVEHILAIADNMGPASNRQVFDFIVDPPEVRAVPPAPPVEAVINAQGVQEVDLIITPGGYSPLRFSVKKDVPVRLTFRALGEVGCGNELNLPTGDGLTASLQLSGPTDSKQLEFRPAQTGEYEFFCGHAMYKGRMIVRE